jgi:heme exporter protein C
MALRILLGVLLTLVIVAALGLPMVQHPQHWYEFPSIPGLEEKARIIFFHVPTAWLSVMAFITSMIYGIRYLRRKDPMDDLTSASAAGLGLLFCVLATVTGAIWAKFNWGSYWNWDPRETSIFVLLLIYGAYFSLRAAVEVEEKRATLSSVYSIIAAVTVPFFVFIMPRIMTGLHPGAKGDPDGAGPVIEFKMSLNMRVVFFSSLIAFTLLFLWMLSLRVRTARLEYHHQPKG